MSVDPRARLTWIRNVRRGLLARSSILRSLERQEWSNVRDLAYDVNLAAATVLYHLHHMIRESIVERDPQGRKWGIAPRHQATLSDYLRPNESENRKKPSRTKKEKGRSTKH